MKIYRVYKKIGETPLEALERLRKQRKLSANAKLTYAGRLDPMASGVLLILQDATQVEREKYMGLDKEYEVEVLFGFETDSYDLLGVPVIPSEGEAVVEGSLNLVKMNKLLESYKGKIKLPVPPYSSIPYKGKPLFEWARIGKKVKLPIKEFKVKSIKLKETRYITLAQLFKYIQTNINKVKGDFRQEKILKAWEKVLEKNNLKFKILKFKISVGSGTYIRSIAHDLGKKLKTGGVMFSLKRTRVGKYK